MIFVGTESIEALIQKCAYINGEYWISDTGYVMYADGGVGAMNHEMYVIEQLIREVLDIFDIDYAEVSFDINDYINDFVVKYNERFNDDLISEEFSDDYLLVYIKDVAGKDFSEELKAIGGKTDPRDYAMKHWGWKRIHGNNIQTQTFTSNDAKVITDGVFEILGDESENELFTIEINNTGSIFENVPFYVIDNYNISALRDFKRF